MKDIAPLAGYPEQVGLLCATLQDATKDWRGELWGIDDQNPDITTWRVRSGGPSIGAIILHMIVTEVYWFEMFALGIRPSEEDYTSLLWSEIDVDESQWPDSPHQPLSWYFELHDRYRARTLEAIQRWPSAETTIEHDGQPTTLRWVLGHVIQHESYHGGQIVLLYDLWKNR